MTRKIENQCPKERVENKMSLADKHTINQETITYGPLFPSPKYGDEGKKKESESLYIQNKVNNWTVISSVSEYGQVQMSAEKIIGTLRGYDSEATIKVTVSSTENRVPALKVAKVDSVRQPLFIEISDEKNRTSESFKKDDETYERQFPQSSVLSTKEFFNEIFGAELESLLKEKTVQEHITKISEKVSHVQKPHNRNYREIK